MDMNLFYSDKSKFDFVGYTDCGYLSYCHKPKSQTRYIFTFPQIAVILAFHEASREFVSLKSMTQHIHEKCSLPSNKNRTMILYEDNSTCIAQIKGVYIKGHITKQISRKLF